MNTPDITVSPYLRLVLAGYDLEVKNNTNRFALRLMRGPEVIALTKTKRGGGMTSLEALNKAKLGQWTPNSDFYKKLTQFADVAESLAQSKQAG